MITRFLLQFGNGDFQTYHGMHAEKRIAFPYSGGSALEQLAVFSEYDPDCHLVPIQFARHGECGKQQARSFDAVGVALDPLALLCALDDDDKYNGCQSRLAAIRTEAAKGIYSYPYRNPGHKAEYIARKLENAKAMVEQCPADE